MSQIKFGSSRQPNRFWNLPRQMENLPLNMKRSQLYPQFPEKVGTMVQNWDPNQTPPQYLPVRFGYRANKIYPDTTNTPSVVAGLMQAMHSPLGAAAAYAAGNKVRDDINQSRNVVAQTMQYNPVWRPVSNPADAAFIASQVPTQTRETVPAAYLETQNYKQQLIARATVQPSIDKARAIREALNTSNGLPKRNVAW